MRTVWKFDLPSSCSSVVMPKGATVLHVADQRGLPRVWALVDDAAPPEHRVFLVVGTGHPVPPDAGAHVGSFLTSAFAGDPAGKFVFHVFEAS